MSAPAQSRDPDGRSFSDLLRTANPWVTALGMLGAALVLGGVIASAIGIDTMGHYGAVLGQVPEFDAAAALTVTGIASVALGLSIGSAWLIVNASRWGRTAGGPRSADIPAGDIALPPRKL